MGVVNDQDRLNAMLENPTSTTQSVPSVNAAMADDVNDKLRTKLIAKRQLEGQEAVPEDLFAKKPKYELSEEEKKRLYERRLRNKEAAEKSRRKKKEEFEKLQQENDQLNQDKCELAAMISKQKTDIDTLLQENLKLKKKTDMLCRFIAERAKEFGLDKHVQREQHQQTTLTEHDSQNPIIRQDRDPTLQHTAVTPRRISEDQRSQRSSASSSAGTPPPPVAQEHHVMVNVSPKPLQTPWQVEQASSSKPPAAPVAETPMEAEEKEEDVLVIDEEQPQPVQEEMQPQPQEQKVVYLSENYYLPPDTILIVQEESEGQITAVEATQEPTTVETQNQAQEEKESQHVAVLKRQSDDDDDAAKSQTAEPETESSAASVPAPSAEESVVSTTTTPTPTTTSEHVSREQLLTFVEALLKAGVKFDMSSLPALYSKGPEETQGTNGPNSPRESGGTVVMAH